MTVLYINNEHCFSIHQLKQYFKFPIKYGSDLFLDIIDYGRSGDISTWLREHNENILADNIDSIDNNIGDGEYISKLTDIMTNKQTSNSNSKPNFLELFKIEGIEVKESDKDTMICVNLKVIQTFNESYSLKIQSSWGTRHICEINPIDYKINQIIKRGVSFRNRPNTIKDIVLFVDDSILKEVKQKSLTFSVGDYEFKMILVEHGSFYMGTSEKSHKVTLSKDFYIGEVPVTQNIWKAIMGRNPSCFGTNNGDAPVENINWHSCLKFIKKLNEELSSQLHGRQFHLPSEAEWEFAARGGNDSQGFKYSGSNSYKDVAWCNNKSNTNKVAKLKPNELGIYDTCGNVWEWCLDHWKKDLGKEDKIDPIETCNSESRVVRGGSYTDAALNCFIYSRNFYNVTEANCLVGMRLCLSDFSE